MRLHEHEAATEEVGPVSDDRLTLAPFPVVALNRAVALAEVEGPGAALAVVDDLALDRYHLYHSTRGDLLQRLGRTTEAADAFTRAADLATNTEERRYLQARRSDAAREI